METQENVVRIRTTIDNSSLPSGLRSTEDMVEKSHKRMRDSQGRFVSGSKSAINDYGNHITSTFDRSGFDAINALKQYIGPAAMLALGVAAGKAFFDGVQDSIAKAGKLQTEVAKSLSIKPQLDTKQFFHDLSDLQTRVPKAADEMASAAYDIFSSIDVTQKEALGLVEKFSKGATAAVTDTKVWGTAVMGVMNAYKLSVEDVDHVQDVFFNTIKSGVVNGNELATSLGVVTQASKNAGVGLDEMGALIAAVTKEGGNASQNINNLANTLQKLPTKETTKALHNLGVEVLDANKNFRPIMDVLHDLDEKLKVMSQGNRSKWLQAIFPDAQARTGLQTILSQLQFVEEQLKTNQTEAGAAGTAYQSMAETYEVAAKLQENSMNRLQEAIGELIITHPAYIEAMKITTEQINGMTDSTQQAGSETQKFADDMITAWSKVKANTIPFLGFMKSLFAAFLHGLHALVSGIVGVIALAVESVINLAIAGVKEGINTVIGALNLVQSVSAKVFPDSLMGRMGQIDPYEHKWTHALRSDIPLEGTKLAWNNFTKSLTDAKKFADEGRAASDRIDSSVSTYNNPAARDERARLAAERTRLDEERIARARQLAAEAEERNKKLGQNAAGGAGGADPSGRKAREQKIKDEGDRFRLSDFKDVAAAFKELTGHVLATSAYGQSKYHNKIGLDHSNSVDVPLNPNSPDGKILVQLLEQMGVPFRAFDKRHVRADGVVTATGPHIHVGEPSHAFGKNVKSVAVDRNDAQKYVMVNGQVVPVDQTSEAFRKNLFADMQNRPIAQEQGTIATQLYNKPDLTVDEQFVKDRRDGLGTRELVLRERNFAEEIKDVWIEVANQRKNAHMDAVVEIERSEQRLAGKIQDNADAEVVANRRTLMVRQEQEELYDRLTAAQDRMATSTENTAMRMQVAYVEAYEEIQNRSVEAYERMAAAQAQLEDQTVFHSEQMRAAVMDHAASAKSVTEIWSDAYTGAMDAIGDGISKVVGKLTDGMGMFGDVINDVISNLMRLVTNRLMMKLLDYIMGNKGGSSGGSVGGSGAGGGVVGGIMNMGGNVIQGLFNRGAGATATTGGYAGGNPLQAILNGQGAGPIASVFGHAGAVADGSYGQGAFSRSITDQAAQQFSNQQAIAGAIQQAGGGVAGSATQTAASAPAKMGMGDMIAQMLPMLGMGAGASLGQGSPVGTILGGAGGLVAGMLGGGLITAIGSGTFAGTTIGGWAGTLGSAMGGGLALGAATLGIGAAVALFAAWAIGRSAKRRKEETIRDGAIRAANSAVDDIIKQLRAGEVTTDQALAGANQIRQQYLDQMSQLTDKKTRNHALATVREIDYRINLIKQIGPDVMSKQAAAERLRPEFETGGVVAGALGTRQHIVAHAGEIIINSSQQTPQVMAALHMAGVPDVRGVVAMGNNQQSGGSGGGNVGAVNVTVVLGKQDQTEILINGLKSDNGKRELGRVMRNIKKDGE